MIHDGPGLTPRCKLPIYRRKYKGSDHIQPNGLLAGLGPVICSIFHTDESSSVTCPETIMPTTESDAQPYYAFGGVSALT